MNPWKPIAIVADYFFGLVDFVGQAIDDIDWWFDDEPPFSMGGKVTDSIVDFVDRGCDYIVPDGTLDKNHELLIDLNQSAG